MCSILGYAGKDLTKEEVEKSLYKTVKRGPDGQRVIETDFGFLGFARLAIMGLNEEGMQPFEVNGNLAVCNGELYGFRKKKRELEIKGYCFKSDSDCELILPMYQEYGTNMFSILDAEFACILYDAAEKKLIAARDPIGIRPLFYGFTQNGGILLASEAKNLTGLVSQIRIFPPGHYMICNKPDEQANSAMSCELFRYKDITEVNCEREEKSGSDTAALHQNKNRDEICRKIHDLLVKGVEKRLDADAPLGFLLSGGLDSSLVCAIAAHSMKRPLRTFAIGMETDAIDLKYARRVADFIGAIHTEVLMTRKQVIDSLEEVIAVLGTYDITTIRASMGMYLVCKAIHETTDIKVLMTGEISDELFGYKYTDFAPNAEAFQKEAEKRIREIHCYDVLRADRCLAANSLEARVPFGDLDFVRYVMNIDPELKRNTYGMGKYLLRKAFQQDEILPEEILWREKAAFSDAVGHSMVDDLKEYAESCYTQEEYEAGIRKYTHARPFTKESLLYRDIFEKYYPGEATMIPDFWMPNKQWEGCAVDDPSARALKNYGKSGKQLFEL